MSIPWESFIQVFALWMVVTLACSVAVSLQVAAATGRSRIPAVALGLVVPLIGPWIWGGIEYARLRQQGYSAWRGRSSIQLAAGPALLWAAGTLLLIALFLPWVHAQAVVDGRFSGGIDPTPLDTVIGAMTLLVAAVALLGLGLVASQQSMRRVAIVAGSVASLLLLLGLSSVIVYQQADGTGEAVRGWTGQAVAGDISAGSALWLTVLAGVLAVAGAAVVAVAASRRTGFTATGSTPVAGMGAASWGTPPGDSYNWGGTGQRSDDAPGGW